MAVASPALKRVTSRGGRVVCRRRGGRIAGGIVIGLGTGLGAAGAAAISATLAAAWVVSIGLSGNSSIHGAAPRTLARADIQPPPAAVQVSSRPADLPFASRWATATPPEPLSKGHPSNHAPNFRALAALIPAKRIAERAGSVPLPRPHPMTQERAATQVASAAAPLTTGSIPSEPAKPVPDQPARSKPFALPGPDSRTAVYDIASGTVHMPNGEKLEAHSGLGDKMDDPRFVHVRMRGSTPPNVYDLTLRENLFHGVRAIRLNPVDDDKMFGRDGILAHSYMLGGNGQSNGCVSFRDYPKFLNAFLKGEVDRMVVVANLNNAPLGVTPIRTARASKVRPWRLAESRMAASTPASTIDQW